MSFITKYWTYLDIGKQDIYAEKIIASPYSHSNFLTIDPSPAAAIPGPFLAPYTRLWHIIRIFVGDINTLSIWEHERHGPFMRIAHDEVSVCHPDVIRTLLLNPIPKYKVLALPDHRIQTPMSTTDPGRRVEAAKNVASAYTLSNVIKSERYMNEMISLMLDKFDQFSDKQQSVEFDHWFNYLAFDIVGEVVFSQRFGFIKGGKDMGDSIANSRTLNAYITAAGYLQWLHNLTLGLYSLHRRETNPHARNDMVEHWKRTLREHSDRMMITHLQAVATGTVGAGADTVNAALQSFVYHMLRKPQAQGRCNDPIVSFAHAQNMGYLQACIKESLRVFGPVPFGLARVAPKGGLKIGERHFPEGAERQRVGRPLSKELFGQDAAEYNPDRWIGEWAKRIEKYFMPVRFLGTCIIRPVRHLATIELSKVIATLPWKYMAYFTAVPYGRPCYISKREDGLR
ncbi:cytochrome P450 [Aspergillus tetrazonus]